MENKFLRGTFFLTMASLISKILGFIYIIPFTALVGEAGYALYKYAYGPYTLILALSTVGLPLAVSKFVSKYNGRGNYKASQDLLKIGILLMTITGLIALVALYSLAPYLSGIVTDPGDTTGNSKQDVIFVIRMVSFALLIVPAMSLLRGYFQGNQSMGPSALSTVIEQVGRIVFILLGTYVALHYFNSTPSKAVGIGTFGAFIGGIAGLVVLITVFIKRKRIIQKEVDASKHNEKINAVPMLKELVSYAVPFVIVGLTIPIYQNIDTYTINPLFQSIGYTQREAETVNAVVGLAQILVMVPVSLATAFSLSLIPGITSSFVQNDLTDVHQKITKTIQLLLFFTLPASVGLSLLGRPVYTMIFGLENSPELGGIILSWYSLAAVIFALFTVTAAILQGINKQKMVVIGVGIGILTKIILNVILVPISGEVAPILATYGGFAISVSYNIYLIRKTIHFQVVPLMKSITPVIGLVVIMAVAVISVHHLIDMNVSKAMNRYSMAVLTSILCVLSGLLVYLGLGSRISLIKGFVPLRKNKKSI